MKNGFLRVRWPVIVAALTLLLVPLFLISHVARLRSAAPDRSSLQRVLDEFSRLRRQEKEALVLDRIQALGHEIIVMASSTEASDDRTSRYWALLAVLTEPMARFEDRLQAARLLNASYADEPHLGNVVLSLQVGERRQEEAILREFIVSDSARLRVMAKYALANLLLLSGAAEDSPVLDEVLQLLDEVRDEGKEFRNPVYTDYTLAELADGTIRQLTELRFGDLAPDIEGPDLEGNPLRLSDFRGQVVVLYFWGGW